MEDARPHVSINQGENHSRDILGPRRLANLVIYYIQGFPMKACAQNGSGEAVAVCAI